MKTLKSVPVLVSIGVVVLVAGALAAVVFLSSPAPTLGSLGSDHGGSTGDTVQTGPSEPSARVGTRLDAALPASLLHLRLVDSTGHVRHLADFQGKIVVISDAMTLCQETCPLDTTTLTQTARAVDRAHKGRDVVFLSITVDPKRDTVPQIAAYRRLFRPVPANWLTLTGSPADVNRLWDALGVFRHRVPDKPPLPTNWRTGAPLHYDVVHSDEVFFVDPSGHERFLLEGAPHVSSAAIPKTLYRYLSDTGRSNVAHPRATAWTESEALQVLGWLLGTRLD